MKFQACTLEIHKEMHPNFLLVKNFVTGERDIAPSSFTISIITSFSRWYTETQTLLHYFVNFQKKFELFFFVEKILISKLHYINEHKLIKTLSYKFRSLIFSIQLRSRLETFIEYRNYYSFRRSQFTSKPWWLTLTNNNEMEYFSLSLSLSLYICHAPNPTIKIGTWQPPHTYKVSILKVCKAFLATKIYPQKLKSNKSKIPQ